MSADLAGFDGGAKALIAEMVAFGWTGRRTSKGHWLGKSPDGTATITVPAKMDVPNRSAQNTRAEYRRWLERVTPQEVKDAIVMVTEVAGSPTAIETDIIVRGLTRKGVVALTKPKEAPVTPVAQPNIVSAQPWLARRSPSSTGGVKYPSEAVVQRTWSDGQVDFACSMECGYISDRPRSVSAHYANAHVRSGQVPPLSDRDLVPGGDYTEPLTTRDYEPTDRLVDALAEFLLGVDLEVATPADLARLFLTWAHDRPDLERVEREPRQMTDAEIVARVRSLVWSPLAVDLANAEDFARQSAEQADQAIAQRDAALARLAGVQRDLDALRALAEGIGR